MQACSGDTADAAETGASREKIIAIGVQQSSGK